MNTFDIVVRNFFRLLRCGVLNDIEEIEPMSLFKWRRMFQWVNNRHVGAIAEKGLLMYSQQEKSGVGIDVLSAFRQCIDNKGTNVMELPEVCFSNYFLNRRLKKIRMRELGSDVPDMETLNILNIILYNLILSFNKGLSLNALLCLAKYLRVHKDTINYTLLNTWLGKLSINKYAQLTGTILILFFHFDKTEVPFVKHLDKAASGMMRKTLTTAVQKDDKDIKVWQGKLGVVHNNSSMLRQSLLNTLAYAHYLPTEAISNYLHNIAHSLANLEE